MELTDNIKQALMEKKPGLSEKTIQRYINDTQRIYKQVFGKDLNKEKNFKWIRSIDQIEKYFDEKNRSISTRNTIYSSIIEVIRALDHPDTKGLKDLVEQRQKYGDEYNSIEDGLKSKKQEDSFIDAKLIDDKIDQYEKEIKVNRNPDPDLQQIWMILKLLREFRFRNEVASLEFVTKPIYLQEKGKTERNMIVMDPEGWFISKNKYKTSKKYGEVIIPLEGQILEDIKFFRNLTMKRGNNLFKSSFQKTKRPTMMTSNSLSKYLLNWSNKELPPVTLEDGSKKPRNLAPNMIVKVYESAEHGASKASLSKQSKNRGNKPETMMKHYVSTKKPTGFY